MSTGSHRTARLALTAAVLCVATAAPASGQPATQPRAPAQLTVSSPDLKPNATIPARHVFGGMGCAGQNVSPALRWSGAPAGTKSFAVTVYDPDAPTGSGWWHWVLFNVPATVTSLAAGAGAANGSAIPAGSAQGNTDFGTPGYGGPCPPPGDRPHHYIFTVYALKVPRIDVPANATAAMVGFNLNANALAKGTLTARYGR
jgi:Raf kinase inhibitor-like YbhB/YbcL family protein